MNNANTQKAASAKAEAQPRGNAGAEMSGK
jgi:hypothetical protein